MEEQSLADLAREYGLDASQYQDNDNYGGDDYVADYDEYDRFNDSGYADAEGYSEGKLQGSLLKMFNECKWLW